MSSLRSVPEVNRVGPVPLGVKLREYRRLQDGVVAYIVDGKTLRDRTDVGFTDDGHHFDEPYIPMGEIWLDFDATGGKEYVFTLANAFAEYEARKGGEKAKAAAAHGLEVERKLRHTQPAVKRVEDTYRQQLGVTENGVLVVLVSGTNTRRSFDLDYVEGGHDLVYDWIPKKVVLLDDAVVPGERDAVLVHELMERHLMDEKGWSYQKAHDAATKVEHAGRVNPSYLASSLRSLGWVASTGIGPLQGAPQPPG